MHKYLTKDTHLRPRTKIEGVSLTDPQYAEECNIQRTLEKFGAITPPPIVPLADVVGFQDFRECLERVESAKSAFAAQPATLRQRFGDDMQQFVDYCLNPANRQEMIELGLIRAEVKREPIEVKMVDATPTVSAAPADAQCE